MCKTYTEIYEKYKSEIDDYFKDNARKLHKLVDNVIKRLHFQNIDIDEYYSLSHEIFINSLNDYDDKQSLDCFMFSCLYKKFCTNMTRYNRDKRKNKVKVETKDEYGNVKIEKIEIPDISFDAPINDENGIDLKDKVSSGIDVETSILNNIYSENVEKYLNNLNSIQRRIAELLMNGYLPEEIKNILNLSNGQYNQNYKVLSLFKNVQILKGCEFKEDELEMDTLSTQTMENCKTDKISIASINKKIDKHTIRFDHPLQRESDQWSPSMKGNLVSDILQGNKLLPLVFAEQIINGVPIIWDLDGKQRCTNAYSFSHNGYKVSKNIRRWNIKYQTTEKDENGNEILDENGFPIAKNAEFDIRNKRFSDLPEELQERFLDYTFNYDQYLNCSDSDIGYHIERYNDGKPMNKEQKGITKIGTEFAEMVKSISNMPFFKDMGGYKVSDFNNGKIHRVIVESVMATNYFDDWNKDLEAQCKYIKSNATTDVFDDFEDMVERLEKVITSDVSDMFDSKDSFLYFGLFSKFVNTGLDDNKFIEFLAEFSRSLHSKSVNGVSYDELCINKNTGKTYGTKDKYIVVPKMEHLETLMNEFLHIDSETNIEETENITTEEFISKVVDMPLEDVKADIELYEDSLKDLADNTIKDGSRLLEVANHLSLLAMVAYSYKNDIDLDEWMEDFAANNDMYIKDQAKNFLHMVQSCNKYQCRN